MAQPLVKPWLYAWFLSAQRLALAEGLCCLFDWDCFMAPGIGIGADVDLGLPSPSIRRPLTLAIVTRKELRKTKLVSIRTRQWKRVWIRSELTETTY